jgi:hypothetical protein
MNSTGAVVQIGIVVPDARKAAVQYARLLGLREWKINQVDTANGVGRNFRSRDREVTVKALIAWTNIGDVEIELIEPQDDSSPYARFLHESGPGVHHIMLAMGDFESDSQSLQDGAIPPLLSGELQATRFRLFDSRDTLGTIVEIAAGGSLVPDDAIDVDD